jgi:hypothetical protein
MGEPVIIKVQYLYRLARDQSQTVVHRLDVIDYANLAMIPFR